MRIWLTTLLLILAGVACTVSDDDGDSTLKRCFALRDHLIDLRIESANKLVDERAHREALRQSLGDEFVDRCRERPLDEIKCALAAKDTSSVADCASSQ